jgi:hypothetical protein
VCGVVYGHLRILGVSHTDWFPQNIPLRSMPVSSSVPGPQVRPPSTPQAENGGGPMGYSCVFKEEGPRHSRKIYKWYKTGENYILDELFDGDTLRILNKYRNEASALPDTGWISKCVLFYTDVLVHRVFFSVRKIVRIFSAPRLQQPLQYNFVSTVCWRDKEGIKQDLIVCYANRKEGNNDKSFF